MIRTVFAHIYKLLAISFLTLLNQQTLAQHTSYSLQYTDSLQLEKGERFLTNSFVFKNKEKDSITLEFNLTVPAGWQAINKLKKLQLAPGEEYVIPISLVPGQSTPAVWYTFMLQVQKLGTPQLQHYTFWGRTYPVMRYNAFLLSRQEQLSGNQRQVALKLFLQNSGNTDGRFTIQFQNRYLGLQHRASHFLPSNADSVFTLPLTLSKNQWKGLNKEVIAVKLIDTTGAVKLMLFDLTKAHTTLKQHPFAHQTMPLEFELGAMLNENQLTYFSVVKGKISLKEKLNLDFSYKTKEMGAFHHVQNDVLNLTLSSPKLILFAGQITDAKHFIGFGNGIKAQYKHNEREYYFAGTLHNKNFYYKNDQFELGVRHKVGKVKLDQSFAANFDPTAQMNSFLLINKADVINRENLTVSLSAGLGLNHGPSVIVNSNKPTTAFSYSANYQFQKWQASSSLQANSKLFPGVNKGLRDQHHNLTWRGEKVTISTFFRSNQRIVSVFRDSLYNSDFLSFNTQKFGLYTGLKLEKMNLGFSMGKFGQFGVTSSNSLDMYNYAEAFYFWQPSKNFKLNISSFNGYGSLTGEQSGAWINSSTAGLFYKRLGVSALYTRNPRIVSDSGTKRLQHYEETMNLTPAFNFTLLRRVFVNFSYTFSQTSYDDRLTSYCSGSIAYVGKNNGLSLNLYGMLPITKSNANSPGLKREYFTLSIRKKLVMPLLFKRKYHDLKVIPFFDDNNNGKKDKNEKGLATTMVNINGTSFVTNKKGVVAYQNVSKGTYTIDLNSVNGFNGFVPAGGVVQKVAVNKHTEVQVPFKKSKIIAGQIMVELDSLSNIKFTPGGIKVIARDSMDRIYSTLANEQGFFELNVPADTYLVSLNPEAFDEKIKPEVMAFSVDMTNKNREEIQFIIKQQKRKVRLLKN